MAKVAKSFVLLLVVIGSVLYSIAATHVQNVSLLQLITEPEKFDGRTIAVVGFLEMSFDGNMLYLHQQDAENWIASNAVWVRRTKQMDKNESSLNRKYIKLVGKFKVGYREQLGDPPNGFIEVEELRLWSDPSDPIGRKKIPGVSSTP